MIHRLAMFLALATLLSAAVAQESDTDAPEDEPAIEEQEDDTASEEEIDESGLDAQGFEEEDDDDFVPTEDIPTDQSIPFPTDI